MKRLILFLLPLFILIAIPTIVFAQDAVSNEAVVLGPDETIDEDYFATGETVNISGTVNGDAYVAAGKVFVDGTINGDLIVVAGNARLRGVVRDNVRIAAGSINISGPIGQSLTVITGNTNIEDSATIGGSVVAMGGNIEIFAPIARGITVAGGSVTIGNTVGGNILAGVGQLTLASPAAVDGNLTYFSDEELSVSKGATVSGAVSHEASIHHDQQRVKEQAGKAFAAMYLFFKVVSFVSSLILGLLLIFLAPNTVQKTKDTLATSSVKSVMLGLLALFLTPVIFGALLVTIVGIPLAFIFLFLMFLVFYFSKIFVAVFIGQKILSFVNQKMPIAWTFILGLIIYYFFASLPILGGFVHIAAIASGTGALLLTKKQLYTNLRNKKIV